MPPKTLMSVEDRFVKIKWSIALKLKVLADPHCKTRGLPRADRSWSKLQKRAVITELKIWYGKRWLSMLTTWDNNDELPY